MPARCATPHDLVAAFTGLRLGELRALRSRDLDFSNRLVHVRRSRYGGLSGEDGPAKSGKARSVPLIDQAARPLDALSRREQWTGPSDRVFCDERGRPLTGGAIREAFYSASRPLGSTDAHGPQKIPPVMWSDGTAEDHKAQRPRGFASTPSSLVLDAIAPG